MGVIDTLSAGYAAVNRRLWLLGIPIALDLVFWAGPRLGLDRFATTFTLPLAAPGQAEGAQAVPASFDLLMLLAMLVFIALQLAIIWAAIHLYFALPAVVVGAHGPIAAIKSSVQVVRQSLWSALGLIGFILVISVGISLVWQILGSQPLGTLVGIVANAYVMTGLSAATLLFYYDRTRESADGAAPDTPPADWSAGRHENETAKRRDPSSERARDRLKP